MSMADIYWNKFLKASGRDQNESYSGELCFENKNFTGDEQIALVLAGKKTASFSPFPAYAINREPLPVAGELYVVDDRNDNPRCIIELTDVSVIPFDEITWEMAQREGEDENIESWRDKQRDYIRDEADICGFEFSEKTNIVCEQFRVIWRG